MRVAALAGAIGLAAALSGCSDEIVFACSDDAQCIGPEGEAGTCQIGGYCSYEDPECESSQRYGPNAAADLAGYCVPTLPATGVPPEEDPGLDADGGSSGAIEDEQCTPETLRLSPTLAACRSEDGHDPTECTQKIGEHLMLVDQAASMLQHAAITSYLAFVAPEPLERVDAVRLHLWVADEEEGSDSTGQIWQTEPFNGSTLRDSSPALVDESPLAPEQGYVSSGTRVTWELDVAALEGLATLHLAVVPMSDDGLRFVARNIVDRTPVLEVEYCRQPQ